MRLTLAILFSFALAASAQIPPSVLNDLTMAAVSTPAASASTFVPTNEPAGSGANLISWWLYSDYYTNSGVATLPDRGGKNQYDLTNRVEYAFPTTNESGLYFDGVTNYIKSVNYTSPQPHEIVMVFASLIASNSAAAGYFFDSATTNATLDRNVFYHHASSQWRISSVTDLTVSLPLTNKFVCISAIFEGAKSKFYTNKILAVTGNASTQPQNGMTLGMRYGLTLPGKFYLKELVTYSSTNTVAQRSNLYYYFKTIKGYPLP